jgi:hypothetical protein
MPSEGPFWLYHNGHSAIPKSMTDDSYYPSDPEDRSDDHQHAREACQHAADSMRIPLKSLEREVRQGVQGR